MHHILEKNKRVNSKRIKILDTSSESASYQVQGQGKKSRSELRKFLQNLNPESKQIMLAIEAIQNDLKMRTEMYGQDHQSTVDCLKHLVKTGNEHALHLIKKGEQKVATEILHQCEYILLGPIGQRFPDLKYQTFNNLAHAHNVQANVRLSLKYLLRGLEYASLIEGADRPRMSKDETHISLVETLLNTCNAYSFLGQSDDALAYAERAIVLSHKQISELVQILEDPNLSAEQREFMSDQYHQQINLHAMSFHTKGQIYEKLKMYDEAILEYQSGKQVIEQNYGSSHKLYVDFANSINGAKLRIKYYMHSNLPTEQIVSQQIQQEIRPVEDNQNLFLQEQERIKPIRQQKRLRPSSAKSNQSLRNIKINTSSSSFSLQQANNSSSDLRNPRSLGQHKNSIASIKNRSLKRIIRKYPQQINPPLSNRSTSSSNKEFDFGNQRKKLQQKMRVYHENQHSKSRKHNHECDDCHKQLEEIRKLQIEQQRFMNMMFEQSYKQMASQAQASSTIQPPSDSSPLGFSTSSRNSQMQQNPPMPMYYPYPPPYFYPPPPYMPYYPPYAMPLGYPPMPNNYMSGPQAEQNRLTPDNLPPSMQAYHPYYNQWDQQMRSDGQRPPDKSPSDNRTPPLPNFHPRQQHHEQESHQQRSMHTDINERDSNFEDDYNETLRYSNTGNSMQQLGKIRQVQFNNQDVSDHQPQLPSDNTHSEPILEHYLDSATDDNFIQSKASIKMKSNVNEQKLDSIKLQIVDRSKLEQAALKIQKYYRRHRAQMHFYQLLNMRRKKVQFHRTLYRLESKQKVLLVLSLVSILKKQTGKLVQVPSMIEIELYDQKQKRVIYSNPLKLEMFGFKASDQAANNEIFNKVKAIFSKIRYSGKPQKDFTSELNTLLNEYKHSSSQHHKKIVFQDPQYFNEDFKEVKNIHVSPQKLSFVSKEESYDFKEDSQIQDDYSNFSKQQVNKSIKEESPKYLSKKSSVLKDDYESFKEESIHDEYEDHDNDFEQEDSVDIKQHEIKMEEAHSQASDQFEEEEVKGDEATHAYFDQSDFNAVKTAIEQEKRRLRAIVLIQARVRGILHRKQAEVEKGKKTKITQYVSNQGKGRKALVVLTEKYSYKKDKTSYQVVVKSVGKNSKKDVHKMQLNQLPVHDEWAKEFLQKFLTIEWIGDKISKVTLDPQPDIRSLIGNQAIKVYHNDIPIVKEYSIKEQKSTVKERTVRESAQKDLSIEKEYEEVREIPQQSLKPETAPHLTDEEAMKQKDIIQKLINEKDKKAKAVAKAQALIKGYLARRHIAHKLDDSNYKMLMRLSRRLSDKKLYYIFLMIRNKHQVSSVEEPYYLVTLREVKNINEIYDLEISLEMAKKIFGRKSSSTAEVNRLINFETNKQEFKLMLDCLDIINEEFSLDFKKFRQCQMQTPIAGLINNEFESSIPDSFRVKKHEETKSPLKPNDKVQSAQISEEEDNYDESFKEESVKEHIIEEAESKFEVSPQQQTLKSEQQIKDTKNSITKKDELIQQATPVKNDTRPTSPNKNAKKSPNKSQTQTQALSAYSRKMRAIVRVQSWARGFLARQRDYCLNQPNFKNKEKDPQKHLKLYKQSVIRCCGLFFMYFIYADQHQEYCLVTVRETIKKITIINLKKIVFADFGEQNVEIEDIAEYIQDNFNDYGPEILLNPKTKQLKHDWVVHLHEFLDNL